MEKLIYALWRDGGTDRATFNARLLGPVAQDLLAHVHALRINVQDDSVAEGSSPRFVVTDPQMEAAVQVWIDTAYPPARAPIEAALSGVASRIEGWLVSESTILPNRLHPPGPGRPTEGFSQFVFLERPDGVPYEIWRDAWQNGHTPVAIETQSNFEYVQNLIVRPLTTGAGDYAAIVEECFPAAALHDAALFYDASENPKAHAANHARMMASCGRFMGPKGADCFPTRQYEVKPAAWARNTA